MVGCSPSPSPPPTPTPSLEPSITTPIVTPTPNIQPTYGNYCASKNSDIFHHCLCIYVHNILMKTSFDLIPEIKHWQPEEDHVRHANHKMRLFPHENRCYLYLSLLKDRLTITNGDNWYSNNY